MDVQEYNGKTNEYDAYQTKFIHSWEKKVEALDEDKEEYEKVAQQLKDVTPDTYDLMCDFGIFQKYSDKCINIIWDVSTGIIEKEGGIVTLGSYLNLGEWIWRLAVVRYNEGNLELVDRFLKSKDPRYVKFAEAIVRTMLILRVEVHKSGKWFKGGYQMDYYQEACDYFYVVKEEIKSTNKAEDRIVKAEAKDKIMI